MPRKQERTSYNGFPMLVTDESVRVYDRMDERLLAKCTSIKQARLFIKGYRKAERDAH